MKYSFLILIIFFYACEDICIEADDGQDNSEAFVDVDEYFYFNQSDLIAYYFFDQVLINNQQIDSTDWVAAFNGDICVGAKKWNCSSTTCNLAIYGYNNLNNLTNGYMVPGDLPLFKIYDASDSIYYDALPSSFIPWQDGDFNQIEVLIAE